MRTKKEIRARIGSIEGHILNYSKAAGGLPELTERRKRLEGNIVNLEADRQMCLWALPNLKRPSRVEQKLIEITAEMQRCEGYWEDEPDGQKYHPMLMRLWAERSCLRWILEVCDNEKP